MPLRRSLSASLLWKRRLLYDGVRLSLDRTPRESGLFNGAILQRDAWPAGQQAAYARHLRCSSALATAKAIGRDAEPPDERGVRVLHVISCLVGVEVIGC